jgi:hypothetical protein
MGSLERWSAGNLGQWHYVLGYTIVLLAHNWPLLLALALCLFWGRRLYRRPDRLHVCWFFAGLLLGITYEYDKHVAPTLHASLDTVLGLEAGWLNQPAHYAVGPAAKLLLSGATVFFLGQALWLTVHSRRRDGEHSPPAQRELQATHGKPDD